MRQHFNPKNDRSLMLRTHCQTSGVSLASKDPYTNIIRTTIEALAAVLGGTQSLHTNSFDEALGLPTEASARIARNTQLVLREEVGLAKVIDPLGGSYYVESLTAYIVSEARILITEVEDIGGMTKAVSSGLPKLRIEEAAAERQARIDQAEEIVIGVNQYAGSNESDVSILSVDNAQVRCSQIRNLEKIRKSRNKEACEIALDSLKNAAGRNDGNLVKYAVDAARQRATVGEISDALERVFGRHTAEIRSISGVYGRASADNEEFIALRGKVSEFSRNYGRQPRLLVAKLGQDGHDRGAKVIATGLADLGFDIDLGPLFQTPLEVARQAIENDVHVVGISSQVASHTTLIPELMAALRAKGGDDIVVTLGGVIPPEDREAMRQCGVAEIFGPGISILEAAEAILKLLTK